MDDKTQLAGQMMAALLIGREIPRVENAVLAQLAACAVDAAEYVMQTIRFREQDPKFTAADPKDFVPLSVASRHGINIEDEDARR
ncbi:MAG: hypothetical protein DMF62_02370 [Acidobacteria bacterium]|nr:MAG: hypothetical protein DMF62_02370 [Acidobacteriota bacterium]